MKRHRAWLLLFTAIVLIVALLFWRRPIQRTVVSTPAIQATAQPSNASPSVANIVAQNNSATFATTNAKPPIQNDRSRLPEIYEKANATHNIPVEFYGQVIDQNSNPVAGVKIDVTVRQQYVKSPTEYSGYDVEIPMEASSEEDGRFVIQGKKGDSLHIDSIQKDGYQLSSQVRKTYGYVGTAIPFHPDSQNPVIIKMWKNAVSAQLISQDKDTRIPYDGTPVTFNLLTGQKNVDNSAGDLRVTLIRNPLNIPSDYRNAFEWHATIEAVDGGLIQSDDEFMYEAPEEGYQPQIQIDMPTNAANWSNIYDISFYAKTRGGKVYSRVKFEFRVDSSKPQTGFTITSSANPNGSRNLQP